MSDTCQGKRVHARGETVRSRINAERKILILQDDVMDGRSLAQEYVRRYDGIMDDVEIWRYLAAEDQSDDVAEIVRRKGPPWDLGQQ